MQFLEAKFNLDHSNQFGIEIPSESPVAGDQSRRLQRTAEISADRFGLLTCRNIDTACSTMIKVASSLSEPFFKPDLACILEQFRDLANNQGLPETIFSTHPVIPVRIRALLRFEGVFQIFLQQGKIDRVALNRIDGQIDRDIHRASGNVLSRIADRNLESVRTWGLVAIFLSDGVLSKQEQHIMRDVFGETKTGKILELLSLSMIQSPRGRRSASRRRLRQGRSLSLAITPIDPSGTACPL